MICNARVSSTGSFIAALLLSLCIQSKAQEESQPQNLDQFMKTMNRAMTGASNAAVVVDFRELKALLPTNLPNMKRTSATGEKSGAMGMKVSFAEGAYETEEGGSIKIKITDNGGLGSFMALAQAGWSMSDIDRETENGYEKTTTYGGNKALEKYDTSEKSGEIQILVADRFMVEVTGSDVEMDAIKGAVEKIDLNKLAGLKAAPAQTRAPAQK
jgi:hypothetical protein